MSAPVTTGRPPEGDPSTSGLREELMDVIFTFSFDTWGDAVARGMARPPDRLVQTLRKHPRVSRLIVANPFRSAPVRAARKLLRKAEADFPTDERSSLVTPLRLRRNDPVDVPLIRRTYENYDWALRRAAEQRGMDRPTVITTHPFVAAFSSLEWASQCCFYVRDDWSALPARRPWWDAYRAAFREVAASGRPVAAVSQPLLDRIAPRGEGRVVANGIDPHEWAGPAPEPPAWFSEIPGPRALYVGTLDSRLDTRGLVQLAGARPDLSIVLLGVVGEQEALDDLRGVPNIHRHGPVGRSELVAAVRTSDLCLIPHRDTELTRAMSPLKLYEYLAGGRPVLSVDLSPVRGVAERVLLTDTVPQFADRIDECLALGPATEAARQRFIEEHSWARAHEAILELASR